MLKRLLLIIIFAFSQAYRISAHNRNMNYLNNDQVKDLGRKLQDPTTKDEYVLIDIREPWEWDQEHIPHSKNIPVRELRTADVKDLLSKKAVFYCKSGGRTKSYEQQMLTLGFKESYCITGGINQWKDNGLPVQEGNTSSFSFARYKHLMIALVILVILGIYKLL